MPAQVQAVRIRPDAFISQLIHFTSFFSHITCIQSLWRNIFSEQCCQSFKL